MGTKQDMEHIKKQFTELLVKKQLRKTPERYAILTEIYETKGEFDVDDLYMQMCNKKYAISKATIYNNIKLLLESKLLKEHRFGPRYSRFEKNHFGERPSHIILNEGEEVLEFTDDRIHDIKTEIEKRFNIKVADYSIYFFAERSTEG